MFGIGYPELVGMVGVLVIWMAVIVGVIVLARWAAKSGRGVTGQGSARGILDARYARGEVTREQYLQMRQDIEANRADGAGR